MFGPIKPVRRFYQRVFTKDRELVRAIAGIVGTTPDNIRLYKLALTHTSFVKQNASAGGRHDTNERLEFLGDAVLGAVVAELLFRKFPYEDEGFLTEIRSRIVNRESLNHIAVKIGLNLLVKVETGSNRHKSVNGNALEALVGAIYLDKGYNMTRQFILGKLIKPHIDLHNLVNTTANFKSKLIEWAQSQNLDIRFENIRKKQQGNTTEFTTEVYIDDKPVATGVGLSKKKADQAAAEKSLEILKIA